MAEKRAFFIINPKSGKQNYLNVKKIIETYIQKHHPNSEVAVWEQKEQLIELVSKAKTENFDIVFAVGGDGTVHCIGEHFINTNINLGIIPNGSGDGIARHFHISKNIKEALELMDKGQIIRIDTGLLNDSIPFIGFMGTGIDASVAHMFSSLKSRGFIPYVKLAFSEYMKRQTEKYTVTFPDQEPFVVKPQILSIANTSQFGNGAYFSPGSSAMDNTLEFCTLDLVPHAKLPIAIYKIFNATCHQLKEYQRWKFTSMTIERENENHYGHVDGEAIFTEKKFTVKIQEKSLNLLVPKLGLSF